MTMRSRGVLPITDASEGMLRRDVLVRAADVVYVKGIIEASEGLAAVFAESGGELSIVFPAEREDEVMELLGDLERDVALRCEGRLPGGAGRVSADAPGGGVGI
jgi:hypothetical protein